MKKGAKTVTWVVVADGMRARFLMSEDGGMKLVQAPVSEMVDENPPTHLQGTDRPGRTQESVGGGNSGMRHAMAPRVDWHKFEKSKFAHDVAAILGRQLQKRAFSQLVLIAPPETLGNLRRSLSKAAGEVVSYEIAKDLTHMSNDEVGEYVRVFLDRNWRETD